MRRYIDKNSNILDKRGTSSNNIPEFADFNTYTNIYLQYFLLIVLILVIHGLTSPMPIILN